MLEPRHALTDLGCTKWISFAAARTESRKDLGVARIRIRGVILYDFWQGLVVVTGGPRE